MPCFADSSWRVTHAQAALCPRLEHLHSLGMWVDLRPSLPPPLAGVLKFARLVKSYEAQDPEIASLSGKLKALFLPPMTLPPHGPASGGSVAAS